MLSSRRSDDPFLLRSAGRDRGRLQAVPSLGGRRTASASSNYDGAETQRLVWGAWFWRWCVRCSVRARQPRALAQLDDNALKDIGVTRRQADAEASKPFWRK
jgi:uncharacterized protein YjiS (DUF1127 family)